MNLVADVEADQQGGDGLDDARIFEFSTVERASSGNFCREFARDPLCFIVVAANEDVAIDRLLFREQFRAEIVKCGGDGHGRGNKFTRLLGSGALPDT